MDSDGEIDSADPDVSWELVSLSWGCVSCQVNMEDLGGRDVYVSFHNTFPPCPL